MKLALLTMLSLLTTVSTVSATEEDFPICADNGFQTPCLDNLGDITYDCDDPRYKANPLEGGCIVTDKAIEEDPCQYKIELTDREQWDCLNPPDEEGFQLGDGPNDVRVLVYLDIITGYDDPTFAGNAEVCIETKGGPHGDAAECNGSSNDIETAGNMTTIVPFVLETTDTDEGVYLPDGREFFACAMIKADAHDEHIHMCAPGTNNGDDVIAVHIPFSH